VTIEGLETTNVALEQRCEKAELQVTKLKMDLISSSNVGNGTVSGPGKAFLKGDNDDGSSIGDEFATSTRRASYSSRKEKDKDRDKERDRDRDKEKDKDKKDKKEKKDKGRSSREIDREIEGEKDVGEKESKSRPKTSSHSPSRSSGTTKHYMTAVNADFDSQGHHFVGDHFNREVKSHYPRMGRNGDGKHSQSQNLRSSSKDKK